MEDPVERPATLSGELDDRLRVHAGKPWHALLELVAAPERDADALPLRLHGRVLGGVRLVRILGTGGMGVAYEGVDAGGERVAVKVFGHLDEAAALRFESECGMLRSLDHANIVRYRAHGVSPEEGAFLVMDFVCGTDLERILVALEKGEPLDDVGETLVLGAETDVDIHDSASYRRRIVRLVATIADALEHAHAAGIVHRDVKPANLVVRDDLSPVLIDFGLGRDLFRELSWTRSGAVVGTVGWMAPEQLDGDIDAISPRTDVFALGLVLHRALTGRELRKTLRDLGRFRRGPLRLTREDRAGLDDGLLGVLHGCLEPEPRRRYASARDLATDLRAWIAGEPVSHRAPGFFGRIWREPVGRAWILGAALFVVALATFLAWPRTSLVSIMGLEDDQNATISYSDGAPLGRVLPVQDWRVPLGSVHELIYRSVRFPGVEVPIPFVADREYVRVNVLHETPGLVPELGEEQGVGFAKDTGLLHVTTRCEPELLTVDGKPFQMAVFRSPGGPGGLGGGESHVRARIRLPIGRHEVELRSRSGETAKQVVLIQPMRVEPCSLLGGRLRDVPGAIRMEWASVLAAPPTGLSVELDGVAGPFMDGAAEVRSGDGYRMSDGLIYLERNTGYSPLAPARAAVVVLRVEFERPIRSLFATVEIRCVDNPGNSLHVAWALDGSDWQDVPTIHDGVSRRGTDKPYQVRGIGDFDDFGSFPIDVHDLPAPGARVLRIRCAMTVAQVNQDSVFVRFLAGYVNATMQIAPAFDLVADPDPAPRIPR
ncbi:MAG: serine/threonine protein kinase [Planctomycetes bacterium]|nr:serine/threonine protein kinase [Planctomycetota bacterium]